VLLLLLLLLRFVAVAVVVVLFSLTQKGHALARHHSPHPPLNSHTH
jgi:hypothetical protein